MKIAKLALANAVKCGAKTADFLTSDNYDMSIDGITVKIVNKSDNGVICFTTLMNTKWWHHLDESAEAAPTKGKRR